MKIKFIYSKLNELNKLTDIYSEYQWFFDQKFPIYLPKFYDKIYHDAKGKKKLFVNALTKEFGKIYRREDYITKTNQIRHNWLQIENQFIAILENLGFKLKNKYICKTSLYGPQGQFRYPNTVNLRARVKNDIKYANETIAHEIIHLVIYSKAKKMKLSYPQIEGVVDLFFKETKLKNMFPKYELQSIAAHNKAVLNKIIKH